MSKSKIDQVEIDRATVDYYKSGKKVKKVKTIHFDVIQIEKALHIDIWSPQDDPNERKNNHS